MEKLSTNGESKRLPSKELRAILDTNYNIEKSKLYNRIQIAPMIKVSNRPFRVFMRLLTKHTTV